MKTLLLTAFFSFAVFQINGQCTENVSNFGNNTSNNSYNVSGDVKVILNTNNTITLGLGSNFMTAAGPDVRAFLVKSEGKSISDLKSLNPNNLDNIAFGLISCSGCNPVIPSNGAQTLTVAIPDGKDITEFDTVFFNCLQFTAFWDVGNFTPFSSSNCAVLDVDTFKVDVISVYPNPASSNLILSVENSSATGRYMIIDVRGREVLSSFIVGSQKSIDVSDLENGLYKLILLTEDKSLTFSVLIAH